MKKRIVPLAITAIVAAFGVTAAALFLTREEPMPPSAAEAYVKPEISGKYDALMQVIARPEESAPAAEAIVSADPENGYSYYLQAAAIGRKGDPAQVREVLDKGNGQAKVIHYINALPAHESMLTLSRVRELGYVAREAKDLKTEEADALFASIYTAGRRIAMMEPTTSLSVEAGLSVIRSTLKSAETYFAANSDYLEKWTERQASFDAWEKSYKEDFKVDDLIREPAKAAGLTEDEMLMARNGAPLKDARKQRRLEIEVHKFNEREAQKLRDIVATLPE